MNLKVYIVVNQEGKFFRAKGMNGRGDSWVEDINSARIYTKLNPARSVVTFFASKYPTFGIPQIHELSVSNVTVLDETKRVEKILKKKAEEKAKQEKMVLNHRIEHAKFQIKKAQQELEELIK